MRRPASRPSAAETPPAACVTRILRVGADGDGIGRTADGAPLYMPATLPGETVEALPRTRRGEGWACDVGAILDASPERVEPPCPHFGTCGGCTLQHWRSDAYLAWKSGLLRAALARAGYADAAIHIASTPPEARRRMDLALRRIGGEVHVGLHRARGSDIVDLATCVVLAPSLVALIAPLREAAKGLDLLRREGSAIVNLLDSGPDLLLQSDTAPSTADRTKLTAFARTHGLARISWTRGDSAPETLCLLRPATTMFSGVTVEPPPGAFLQTSAEGEAAIIAAVLDGLPGKMTAKARVAELYAGCGTITFALAQHHRVIALEGDQAALAALRRAASRAGLDGRVQASQRDLARQPLLGKDFGGIAAVVLDPPFAGAAQQITHVAAGGVKRVIYVSCNPAALARDAGVLKAAGYRLVRATAIDQFLWSARLEAVVVFERG